MMDIIKVFGTNVRKYRTEKKISQEKFAELFVSPDSRETPQYIWVTDKSAIALISEISNSLLTL